MCIEKTTYSDLEACYSITKSCAKYLIDNGIFQWNEMYPSKEILQKEEAGGRSTSYVLKIMDN